MLGRGRKWMVWTTARHPFPGGTYREYGVLQAGARALWSFDCFNIKNKCQSLTHALIPGINAV